MFKILIVEDEPETSEELERIITEEIDDVYVETAMNVPEGIRCIEAAKASNQLYQAVVLDMMLPPEDGATAAFDEKLCGLVRQKMPHTLIAHITFWKDDDKVKNHLNSVHGLSQIDLSFRLLKDAPEDSNEEGYAAKLISRLKPFLYELRIEEQLNALFSGGGLTGYPVMRSRPRDFTSDRSKTFELATLTRHISNDWQFLGEGLHTRIRDIFKVVEREDGQIRVSLF